MSKKFAIFSVVIGSLALSGCVGGTTYGTGVTHEQQTLEGLTNMFSLGTGDNQEKIDYKERPDLVMPADKQSLPAPVEKSAEQPEGDWIEEPESRLARIRGEATAPDERSGNVPVSELTRDKEGIRVQTRKTTELNPADDRYDWRKKFQEEDEADKEVAERKAQLSYSTGPRRKFLTEPPAIYRTPANDAVAGDLGISDEELEALEEQKKKQELEEKTGRTVYN